MPASSRVHRMKTQHGKTTMSRRTGGTVPPNRDEATMAARYTSSLSTTTARTALLVHA